MTKIEFGNIMAAINAAYPSEKITQDAGKVKLWWQMLGDMDYRTVTRNLTDHIKSNKYPPTIAELRKNVFCNFAGREYDMKSLECALLDVDMRVFVEGERTGAICEN